MDTNMAPQLMFLLAFVGPIVVFAAMLFVMEWISDTFDKE